MEFCVPVCKTVLKGPPPPVPGFVPQGLVDDELCYNVTCKPSNAPLTLGVEDQFKARTIYPGAADLICAPAEKLAAPLCGGKTAKTCGGACPAGDLCEFNKKVCSCVPTKTLCGNAKAPTCGGSCPSDANGKPQNCDDLGGSCTCKQF